MNELESKYRVDKPCEVCRTKGYQIKIFEVSPPGMSTIFPWEVTGHNGNVYSSGCSPTKERAKSAAAKEHRRLAALDAGIMEKD